MTLFHISVFHNVLCCSCTLTAVSDAQISIAAKTETKGLMHRPKPMSHQQLLENWDYNAMHCNVLLNGESP